jgi:hypothetical protein
MKRICHLVAALALAGLLAGCCYKPCAYDPITGVMYGGGLEPCCCGPLDPFCLFCNGCEQPLQPSVWPGGCGGCFSGCGSGWGAGHGNCCQSVPPGGLNCGPHTVMPAPGYGGVLPPGAQMGGNVVYGGPMMGGQIIDGGTVIRQDGMIEPSPHQQKQPSNGTPSAPGSSSPPPTPTAEDETSGAIVPWPMAPPSASQQPAAQPARFQSHNGRWIPAHR